MMPTFIMMSMKSEFFADEGAQILAVFLEAQGQVRAASITTSRAAAS